MFKLIRGAATYDHHLPELHDEIQRATGTYRKRAIHTLL